MSEFSLDWPHGWQTRDGGHFSLHYVGKMRSNGDLMFEKTNGDILLVDENGKTEIGEVNDEDIINAPAPKPEPRKWWANVLRCREGGVVVSIWPERNVADHYAEIALKLSGSTRIACVCIAEGDGLEGEK